MANQKITLHPVGSEDVNLLPKTESTQIIDLGTENCTIALKTDLAQKVPNYSYSQTTTFSDLYALAQNKPFAIGNQGIANFVTAYEIYVQQATGYYHLANAQPYTLISTVFSSSNFVEYGSGGGGAQNAVLYTAQTLTDPQKTQARTNIGALAANNGVMTGTLTVPTVQSAADTDLTIQATGTTSASVDIEATTAVNLESQGINIEATNGDIDIISDGDINLEPDGQLKYNDVEVATVNDFTGTKTGNDWTTITINGVAGNIPTGGGGGSTPNAVLYTAQVLDNSQKAQARTNIGAGTGSYSKPADGIPLTDLTNAVQTSLGKADSALQSLPNNALTTDTVQTISANKKLSASLVDSSDNNIVTSDGNAVSVGSEAKATSIVGENVYLTPKSGGIVSYNGNEVATKNDISGVLPDKSGNANKYLQVNSAGTGLQWATGTGTIPSNMATTDTAQEITGLKTFSNGIKFAEATSISTNNNALVLSNGAGDISLGADANVILSSPAYIGSAANANKIATMNDIPSVSNLVTTNTAQTITGTKTVKYNEDSSYAFYISNNEYGDDDLRTTRFCARGSDTSGQEVDIDFPRTSGTLALTSDIPSGTIYTHSIQLTTSVGSAENIVHLFITLVNKNNTQITTSNYATLVPHNETALYYVGSANIAGAVGVIYSNGKLFVFGSAADATGDTPTVQAVAFDKDIGYFTITDTVVPAN